MLTVHAERLSPTGPDVELIVSERPRGMFSRQVILGDTLDAENIRASYQAGVLRLTIPVAERAKPRKIAIDVQSGERQAIDAKSEDSPSTKAQSQDRRSVNA